MAGAPVEDMILVVVVAGEAVVGEAVVGEVATIAVVVAARAIMIIEEVIGKTMVMEVTMVAKGTIMAVVAGGTIMKVVFRGNVAVAVPVVAERALGEAVLEAQIESAVVGQGTTMKILNVFFGMMRGGRFFHLEQMLILVSTGHVAILLEDSVYTLRL